MLDLKVLDRESFFHYFLSIVFSLTFSFLHYHKNCSFEFSFKRYYPVLPLETFYFFKTMNVIMPPAYTKLVNITYFWFITICHDLFSFELQRVLSIESTSKSTFHTSSLDFSSSLKANSITFTQIFQITESAHSS